MKYHLHSPFHPSPIMFDSSTNITVGDILDLPEPVLHKTISLKVVRRTLYIPLDEPHPDSPDPVKIIILHVEVS